MAVQAQKNIRRATSPTATRKVKFLVDTVHPDYGQVKAGEVLRVQRDYLDDYEELGIAEDTDNELTREPIQPGSGPAPRCLDCGSYNVEGVKIGVD